MLRIARAYIVILLLSALVLAQVLVRDADGMLESGGIDDPGRLPAITHWYAERPALRREHGARAIPDVPREQVQAAP